jgi:hypothetical protein
MFRSSSQFFDENLRVLSFEWSSACDRWFSCKTSKRANLETQITNDEVCACFWSLRCIDHFRTIWRVDWESFTIRLFRRLITKISVSHSRKCRFRELWSKIITWTRASSFFWSCSDQWIIMLCVRFAKNSISCRKESLSKWKCDSTINRNQNVSCNVLIFSLNESSWTWNLWCWSNCELFTWLSLSTKSELDCDFALYRVNRLSRRAASNETNRFKRNDENWNRLTICDDH